MIHIVVQQKLRCHYKTIIPQFKNKLKKKISKKGRSLQMCKGDFPGDSDGKASAYNAGDPGSIPGLGRSPGEGNGSPLQYSCLENPMDGRAW